MEGAEEGGGEGKVEGEGGEDDEGGETMDTFGGPAPPGWGKQGGYLVCSRRMTANEVVIQFGRDE